MDIVLQTSQPIVCVGGKQFIDTLESSVDLAFLIVNSFWRETGPVPLPLVCRMSSLCAAV